MNVDIYSMRIEFQQRGAGHVHGTLWIQLKNLEKLIKHPSGRLVQELKECNVDAEKPFVGITEAFDKLRTDRDLTEKEFKALISFIDEFTTVSLHENTIGKDVAQIAREVNVHNHTKTCRKYNNSCRFNYPRFPTNETIIAKPLKGTKAEKDAVLKKSQEILSKVSGFIEDTETIAEIMNKYKKQLESKLEHPQCIKDRIIELCLKAKVTYEDYMKALAISKVGYKVVLQRDLDEIYVNSYNIEWLRAWNANMDLQVCLDFFAVITYITDYYSKDASGTMRIINEALKKNECKDVKDQMHLISNTFMTHREMGEAEATYRLIPSMNLKGSNVTCQWVPTQPSNERSKRHRKATENQIASGTEVYQLEGHEGLFYEVQDIYSKYLRRPKELDQICFAQFAKMYRSKNLNEIEDSLEHEEYSETIDEESLRHDSFMKFNLIMTFNEDRNHVLPNKIKIKEPKHGEPKLMQKRQFPAALR